MSDTSVSTTGVEVGLIPETLDEEGPDDDLYFYNHDFGIVDSLYEFESGNTNSEAPVMDIPPSPLKCQHEHEQEKEVKTDINRDDIIISMSGMEEECYSSEDDESVYKLFLKDDDGNISDEFRDEQDIDSDVESEDGYEQKSDDIAHLLYAGAPISTSSSCTLLLSFVLKHKLTRVAFNDLLAVIEAHCPKPNKCQGTVKKLFEFVSQAKSNITKHYFCGYCKAYHGTTTVKGKCKICEKQLEKTHAHFIEVPFVKQLQTYYAGK